MAAAAPPQGSFPSMGQNLLATGDHQADTRPARGWDLVYRFIPAIDVLRGYTARDLGRDLLAGLTVASVAVPQAMAYANIFDVPEKYGLYTAIVMTAVGALFNTSRQLINGPTNAISIALLSALAAYEGPGKIQAAVVMALLVGFVQIGITLLRLGDLTRYISNAVIVGFTVGAATLLFLDQLKHLLGIPSAGRAGEHFLLRFWLTAQNLDQVNPWTVAVGGGTIALVLGLRWLGNRLRIQLPSLLLAVVGMSFLAWLGDWQARGVHLIREIPRELPSFDFPHVHWSDVRELTGSALAIALLGLLEAIAMAKAIASKTRQKLDINQQCLSEGVANLAGSFFQCFPGSGSLTRSTINQQAGGVTQWSGVFSALAVAATVLLLAPLAQFIPRASLAGILVVTAFSLVDRHQLVFHMRATRFDAGIVLATALSAIVVSVEFCILIGVFLSFLLYVPRAARVHLTEIIMTPERVLREKLPGETPCGRILIFSLEGELFFGSAPDLEDHLAMIAQRAGDGIRFVVLRLKRVRNADAVCLGILDHFLQEMEKRQVTVMLCGVRRDLAKVLRSSGLEARLGRHRLFRESVGASSTLDAVRQAYELLGADLCATCPRRGDSGREILYYMI
jgi:SulP family sulfate permease